MRCSLCLIGLVAMMTGQGASPQVALAPDAREALKARLVGAVAKETGFSLDKTGSQIKTIRREGNDLAVEIDCGRSFVANGYRYKGLFLRQPWDGQLLGVAKLTYKVLVLGGDVVNGGLQPISRALSMEDKTCGKTWTWNFEKYPAWELRDKTTGELVDRVEPGKEYPCHLHLDKVAIYDNTKGDLYVGSDGQVRHSRYTEVLRKYINSPEDFEKIRTLWLQGRLALKDGEIIENDHDGGG